MAVIEFARNVLGLGSANSTEFDASVLDPVISELPEQKRIEGLGGTMRLGGQEVDLRGGSLAEFLYRHRVGGPVGGAVSIRERFRHRYEVEPQYIDRLEQAGLIFSGRHPSQPIMQVLELAQPLDAHAAAVADVPTHPFFIAAQFHPELTSRPLGPQPLFMGLVAATLQRKYRSAERHSLDSSVTKWLRGSRPGAAHAPAAHV